MLNHKNTLAYELRLKHPRRGIQADYKNGRTAAIELFCLECMGGQPGLVSNCQSFRCPLWRFRPGSSKLVRPIGCVPTEEEYKELLKD